MLQCTGISVVFIHLYMLRFTPVTVFEVDSCRNRHFLREKFSLKFPLIKGLVDAATKVGFQGLRQTPLQMLVFLSEFRLLN